MNAHILVIFFIVQAIEGGRMAKNKQANRLGYIPVFGHFSTIYFPHPGKKEYGRCGVWNYREYRPVVLNTHLTCIFCISLKSLCAISPTIGGGGNILELNFDKSIHNSFRIE